MTYNRTLTVLATIACLAVMIQAVIAVIHGEDQARLVTTNCQQIEVLKSAIRTSITQSAATLGQPGGTGYAYYRSHPSELKAARKATYAQLAQFAAKPCT